MRLMCYQLWLGIAGSLSSSSGFAPIPPVDAMVTSLTADPTLEGSSMAVVFWTLSTPEPVVSMSNSFAAL